MIRVSDGASEDVVPGRELRNPIPNRPRMPLGVKPVIHHVQPPPVIGDVEKVIRKFQAIGRLKARDPEQVHRLFIAVDRPAIDEDEVGSVNVATGDLERLHSLAERISHRRTAMTGLRLPSE
jgi:hypothetical protein